MKSVSLSIVFLSLILPILGQKDPVILKVNKEKVKKSEFLQIYLKNNPNPKYDKASLDEYMTLFQKFKLKVVEAEALGYDTIPKLKREFEGYKKQLAIPYLIDSAQNQALVQEAYDRTKMEIRCSHILVKLEPTASPADTLEAYNRIVALKKRDQLHHPHTSRSSLRLRQCVPNNQYRTVVKIHTKACLQARIPSESLKNPYLLVYKRYTIDHAKAIFAQNH